MYVSKLTIRNWRNFTKAEVEFEETTYIMGPNACGKSNFLDIFRFMRDVCDPGGGGLQHAISSRGGMPKIRSLAARKPSDIEFRFELMESLRGSEEQGEDTAPDWTYIISIKNEKGGKRRPLIHEEIVLKGNKKLLTRPDSNDKNDPDRLTQTHIEQIGMNKEFRPIADFFEGVLYLHLVPQLLKFSDQLSLAHSESDPFGQGLLDEISGTTLRIRNSRLGRIEKILLKLIPNLERLRFVKDEVTGHPHLEMVYQHWRAHGARQREDQFSDGTLRLIGMLWTLLTSKNVILLEEPELSLHEAVVEQIPKLIHKAHMTRGKLPSQIIISTHSATMLSDTSIDAKYLILLPGIDGESTTISSPSEDDLLAMQSGMSAAEILLPRTAESVQSF